MKNSRRQGCLKSIRRKKKRKNKDKKGHNFVNMSIGFATGSRFQPSFTQINKGKPHHIAWSFSDENGDEPSDARLVHLPVSATGAASYLRPLWNSGTAARLGSQSQCPPVKEIDDQHEKADSQ